MNIPEQEELLALFRPNLDKLFQLAIDDEGHNKFRSYDLERQRRILRGAFDIFWDKSKEKLEGRMTTRGPIDEILKNTILQFSRDYIDEKIASLNEEESNI